MIINKFQLLNGFARMELSNSLFFLQITKFQLISFVHSGRKSPKKSHFKPNSLLTEPSASTAARPPAGD